MKNRFVFFVLLSFIFSLAVSSAYGKKSSADETWKKQVPEPVFEDNAGYIELYWKAWELAHDHIMVKEGLPQSPYMDEAFSKGEDWIWDTCFMVQFCKYSPEVFPGIQTLNNFYAPLHDGVASSGKISIPDNPPLFAWTELEYYKLTGDKEHLEKLIHEKQYLQKHFAWFDTVQPGYVIPPPNKPSRAKTCVKRVPLGYHWEGGRSGMDNTPRGRRGEKATRSRPNNPKMLWIDAIAQQGLSALSIARLAEELGDKALQRKYMAEYEKLKKLVNDHYWDKKDGIYYDIHVDTKKHMKVMTPASFWPMLAEMCSKEQAAQMVKLVKNPEVFGGDIPWVTLARNDPDFVEDYGEYWRGSVWLPTAYMSVKAIQKYGYYELAAENAENIVKHMLKTYKEYEPHTIWECYSPSRAEPAKHGKRRVRANFCGWSALGPISLFIENVLGFHVIDASKRRIEWFLHQQGKHGLKNLRFGDILTSIVYEGKGKVAVKSNGAYTLVINGSSYDIKKGQKSLTIKTN
ncbi:trehalase family glycosidase [Verrucomicrobiota bacterium]